MSSTAAATLRQLVMFVYDKVVEEDKRGGDSSRQGGPGRRPRTFT